MSNLKTLGVFLGGVIVGGVATGYVVKTKYEQILEEEIQSVKDVYKNRTGIDEDFIARKELREEDFMENCDIEKVATTDDIHEYNNNKKDNKIKDYTKYHKKTTEEVTEIDGQFVDFKATITEEVREDHYPPTLIDEEEVGMHGYDMQVLTYYADNILVDETDTTVDIDTYVGIENIKLFEDNPGARSMFVRNGQTGIDYEVQRDDMTWSDFAIQMGISPGFDNLHSN